MVPDNWQRLELKDVCRKDISYGIVQTGSHVQDGIPCVRVVDITSKRVDHQSMIRTSHEINIAYKKTILEKDEILLALRGEIGVAVITTADLIGANITRGIARISPNKIIVDPIFLLWSIRSQAFRDDLLSRVAGSALQEISLGELRKTKLLVPTKTEQTKIAEILSTWDKSIEATERLLENSKKRKKALMQQLLTGKKRLPGFGEGWTEVRLGDVADMGSGGTPSSTVAEYYGGDIPWVSISDMTSSGKWIGATERYLTQCGLENSSARIFPKNTVLYAMYASIGECAIATVPLATSQAILGIRPKAGLSFQYLYFHLQSIKEKIKLQGQQGTQSNLNAGMVKDFIVNLPPLPEQMKIATVLSDLDDEISSIQKRIYLLSREKNALMQQLLTGKKRVKVEEAA